MSTKPFKKKSTAPSRHTKKNSSRTERPNETHEQDGDMLYGKHTVLSYLQEQQQVNKVFIQKGSAETIGQPIMKALKAQSIIWQEVPKAKLDEMTDNANHQGIVLMRPAFDYKTLDDCFQLAQSKNEAPFLLILDGIEDPHNLGSILRTADAVGVHGVIIPKRRAVGLTSVVAKTSTGAIEHVPVVRVTNLTQTIEQLKERGVWVFATDMAGEDMRTWNTEGAIAIVIGNEGQGVSPLIKSVVDGIVTIPMNGHVQSLNASVATGILLYEVARKRLP